MVTAPSGGKTYGEQQQERIELNMSINNAWQLAVCNATASKMMHSPAEFAHSFRAFLVMVKEENDKARRGDS